MPEKIIHIDGIGNILFRHSKRARYLNISVKPFYGARVSVPYRVSYTNAVRLVTERKNWLKQHLDKMYELEKMQTQYDENSGYCTKHHQLNLRKGDRKNISVRLLKGNINVVYPSELIPSERILNKLSLVEVKAWHSDFITTSPVAL